MAQYSAKLNHLRISPRKVRLVADLVRNLSINDAQYQLNVSTKRASIPVLKLLNSAISNAKNHKDNVDQKDLFIKEVKVDMAKTFRRFRPVSRGRAHPIAKRGSHITIVLEKKQAKNSKKKNDSQS